MVEYTIFFFVGIVLAFSSTLEIEWISEQRAVAASTLRFFWQAASLTVLYTILENIKGDGGISRPILIYSFGIAIGTFLAIKLKKTKPHWHIHV
jgi:hypothetical protein